jgi:hypothetical protein
VVLVPESTEEVPWPLYRCFLLLDCLARLWQYDSNNAIDIQADVHFIRVYGCVPYQREHFVCATASTWLSLTASNALHEVAWSTVCEAEYVVVVRRASAGGTFKIGAAVTAAMALCSTLVCPLLHGKTGKRVAGTHMGAEVHSSVHCRRQQWSNDRRSTV